MMADVAEMLLPDSDDWRMAYGPYRPYVMYVSIYLFIIFRLGLIYKIFANLFSKFIKPFTHEVLIIIY